MCLFRSDEQDHVFRYDIIIEGNGKNCQRIKKTKKSKIQTIKQSNNQRIKDSKNGFKKLKIQRIKDSKN